MCFVCVRQNLGARHNSSQILILKLLANQFHNKTAAIRMYVYVDKSLYARWGTEDRERDGWSKNCHLVWQCTGKRCRKCWDDEDRVGSPYHSGVCGVQAGCGISLFRRTQRNANQTQPVEGDPRSPSSRYIVQTRWKPRPLGYRYTKNASMQYFSNSEICSLHPMHTPPLNIPKETAVPPFAATQALAPVPFRFLIARDPPTIIKQRKFIYRLDGARNPWKLTSEQDDSVAEDNP